MDKLEELATELEPLVDRHTMAEVLEALALVGALKAEHVTENWSDRQLARAWARTALKIDQAAKTAREHGL